MGTNGHRLCDQRLRHGRLILLRRIIGLNKALVDAWGYYDQLWPNVGSTVARLLSLIIFSYFGATLVSQVNSGQVPVSRIDDLATRILASYYYLKQDSGYPRYGMPCFLHWFLLIFYSVNFDSWGGSGSHVNVQGDHKT